MNPEEDGKHVRVDATELADKLKGTALSKFAHALADAALVNAIKHGELPKWTAAVSALPDLPISHIDTEHERGIAMLTDADVKSIENNAQAFPAEEHAARQTLEKALKDLMPWRKGPFQFAHIHIDTEWHSDWKWNRVLPHISPLQGRCVLDVGCGSGYHLWRMRGAGATNVLGIDPVPLFNMQFAAVQRYINDDAVNMLPITMAALPQKMRVFDSVFSMGILYHRQSPQGHLQELKEALRAGGELVLESLVTTGEGSEELVLDGRYARMRNIWRLPTATLLCQWIQDAGFDNVRCVSVDITSVLEQRSTDWMQHESLFEALDSTNKSLTIEGHPRPRRAIVIAQKPS